MNGWKQVVSDLAKTRRALLAGLLGLGLVILWSGAVFAAGTGYQAGPHAIIDSATDDGGGKIRVSWSLESEPDGVEFHNDLPGKVCVYWAVVTDGVSGGGYEHMLHQRNLEPGGPGGRYGHRRGRRENGVFADAGPLLR